VAATVVAVGIAGVLPGRLGTIAILVSPAVAFVGPDTWLARLERRRLESALRDLPDMLELLAVTVEAGMPPMRALGMVAEEFDGPLASEWRRTAAEVELGTSQQDALEGLSRRLPSDAIRAFVESLGRARQHGVPLGRLLSAQSARARRRHARAVRERAARAGPKIQLIVALLLVPAVLLLVAAGVAAELGRAGVFLAA
jgi:tight adherence protein C